MSREPEMYPCVDNPTYDEEYDTFEDLRQDAESTLGSLNFPLSWYISDEENEYWTQREDERSFRLCIFMPRKSQTAVWSTPEFDRQTVQAWLDSYVRANVEEWYGWTR